MASLKLLSLKFYNTKVLHKLNTFEQVDNILGLRKELIKKEIIEKKDPHIFVYNGGIVQDDYDLMTIDKAIICLIFKPKTLEKSMFSSNPLDLLNNGLINNNFSNELLGNFFNNVNPNMSMNNFQELMESQFRNLLSTSSENQQPLSFIEDKDTVAETNQEKTNDKKDKEIVKNDDESENGEEEVSDEEENDEEEEVSDGEENDIQINNEEIMNLGNQLLNIYNNSSTQIDYSSIEEKYKDQFNEMYNIMEFTDRHKVLQSLEICEGNIENAINYYLS